MISFTIVTIIFLFYYKKYYKETGPSPLLIFFIAAFFLSLYCFECIYRGIEFFLSDEVFYINTASEKLPSRPERFLWILINNLILNHDISFNGFALKIINIPIAACFLIVLWLIFRDKKIFLIPVILPYVAFIAIKNFRDIPILLFTALTILLFHHRKPACMVLGLISLAMLFLLRPFAAGITFIILLLQICFSTIKPIYKLKLSKLPLIKVFLIFIICLSILPVTAQTLKSTIVKQYNWFIHTTSEEGQRMMERIRVQSDPRYASGNRTRDFFIASIRYVATPMPTSLIGRAMEGGSDWGIVDDLIRIVNQFWYYLILIFLIINAPYIPTVFLKFTPAGKALILSMLTYWPIYSFHLYGVSHQRQKLPFQIAVFLIAMAVWENRKIRVPRWLNKRLNEKYLNDNKDLRSGI